VYIYCYDGDFKFQQYKFNCRLYGVNAPENKLGGRIVGGDDGQFEGHFPSIFTQWVYEILLIFFQLII